MRRAFCVVVLMAFVCLLPRAARVGMAGAYIDPVTRITAQDEALYSHSAITMSHGAGWLTPQFLGRPALYKPPLLIWTGALAAKLFGIAHLTLRLPIVLFAALALGLMFLWSAEAAGLQAAVCAVLLLCGDRLFHTLSTLLMTDALLVAFTIAAVYAIFSDPWLESRPAFWGFAGASAAAILTKGVAGLMPIVILGLYCFAARPNQRPSPVRAAQATGLTLALASPWFLYQLAVHPRWFWTEHIAVEIFGFGTGVPPQTSQENPVLFYLLRLAATDPVLLAASVISIPAFIAVLRRRDAGPTLIACWIMVTLAVTLAWQYRNASYLLPLIPALALMAASYGPFASGRSSLWLLSFIAAGTLTKVLMPAAPWGLSYRATTVQPLASTLSAYCEDRRSRLIVLDAADDLYASTLPLRSLRYASIGPEPRGDAYTMPFAQMGIVVKASHFSRLGDLEPGFRDRLHAWGVDSAAPIGTLIVAGSIGELADLILANPTTDFLLPDRYRPYLKTPAHIAAPAAPGYFFFLAKHEEQSTDPLPWTCRM